MEEYLYLLDLEAEVNSKQILIFEFCQSCNIPSEYIYQKHLCISGKRSWVYWRMMNKYKKRDYQNLLNSKQKIKSKSKSKLCTMSKC